MLNKKQTNLQQRNVVEKYCIEKSPIAWNTMRFVCIIRQNFTFPLGPNYLQQNIVHPFSVHSHSNKVLNYRLPFSLKKCLYVLLKQYFCRNVCNGCSKYFDAWHYLFNSLVACECYIKNRYTKFTIANMFVIPLKCPRP